MTRYLPFVVALTMIPLIVLTNGMPFHSGITGFAVSVAFIAGTIQGPLK